MKILVNTVNGLCLEAILVNSNVGIAYCQDRLMKVNHTYVSINEKGDTGDVYTEEKSIDIIPLLVKEGMWI